MIAAVEAAQRHARRAARGRTCSLPTWDDPPYYSLLVEEGDLADAGITDRLAEAVEQRASAPERRVRQQA